MAERILTGLLSLALALPLGAAPALIDPTRPARPGEVVAGAQVSGTGERFVLTSILISDDRRHAVINDQVVSVGDRVDGARVTAIQPYAVRLAVAGGTLTVRLPGVDLQQRHAPEND